MRLLSVFQSDDNTTTNCWFLLVHSLSAGPELPSGQGWSEDPLQGRRCDCLPVQGLCVRCWVLRGQGWSEAQSELMRGGAQLFGAHE